MEAVTGWEDDGQDITLLQEKKGQRQSVKVLADPLHCSCLQLLGTLAANR